MSTTEPTTAKPATITTELKVTASKQAKADMNANDMKRELDEAIELKAEIAKAAPQGATVEGHVMIGKQKFRL